MASKRPGDGNYIGSRRSNKAAKSYAYSSPLPRWRLFALGRKIMVGSFHSYSTHNQRIPDEGLDTAHACFRPWLCRPCSGDCSYPKSPDAPPDGNTATKDEMISRSEGTSDRYNADMNAYLDCLQLEIDSAAPKDASEADDGRAGKS